jgi:hypothetical protein
MRTHSATLSVLALLCAAATLTRAGEAEQKAVAAIKGLGGKVHTPADSARGPVVAVELGGCGVTDAHLVHLGPLSALQSLDL